MDKFFSIFGAANNSLPLFCCEIFGNEIKATNLLLVYFYKKKATEIDRRKRSKKKVWPYTRAVGFVLRCKRWPFENGRDRP
jgi:hypothetical protein